MHWFHIIFITQLESISVYEIQLWEILLFNQTAGQLIKDIVFPGLSNKQHSQLAMCHIDIASYAIYLITLETQYPRLATPCLISVFLEQLNQSMQLLPCYPLVVCILSSSSPDHVMSLSSFFMFSVTILSYHFSQSNIYQAKFVALSTTPLTQLFHTNTQHRLIPGNWPSSQLANSTDNHQYDYASHISYFKI